eukprot:7267489-Pyramimonas_sp.AAC.3
MGHLEGQRALLELALGAALLGVMLGHGGALVVDHGRRGGHDAVAVPVVLGHGGHDAVAVLVVVVAEDLPLVRGHPPLAHARGRRRARGEHLLLPDRHRLAGRAPPAAGEGRTERAAVEG